MSDSTSPRVPEIERFDRPDCDHPMRPNQNHGGWVDFSDHAAILAEKDAEIERLRMERAADTGAAAGSANAALREKDRAEKAEAAVAQRSQPQPVEQRCGGHGKLWPVANGDEVSRPRCCPGCPDCQPVEVEGGELTEVIAAARAWLRKEHGDHRPAYAANRPARRLHDALVALDAVQSPRPSEGGEEVGGVSTATAESIDPKARAARRNAEDAASLRRIASELQGWLGEAPADDPEVAGILRDCEALDRAAQVLATPPIHLPLTLVANSATQQEEVGRG